MHYTLSETDGYDALFDVDAVMRMQIKSTAGLAL